MIGEVVGFAVDCCGGEVAGTFERVIGDDDAGVIVRDVGLTIGAIAGFDPDCGGGAPPFCLIGMDPPAMLCCNEALA